MCIFNAGLRLNQAISLWKNQRKCPRLWGSKTGNTGVLFPLTEERGEKIFRKKVATHPVAQEVSPKVQFGLKEIDHFWDAAFAGAGFAFMDQKRRTTEKEKLLYT